MSSHLQEWRMCPTVEEEETRQQGELSEWSCGLWGHGCSSMTPMERRWENVTLGWRGDPKVETLGWRGDHGMRSFGEQTIQLFFTFFDSPLCYECLWHLTSREASSPVFPFFFSTKMYPWERQVPKLCKLYPARTSLNVLLSVGSDSAGSIVEPKIHHF